MAFYLYYFCRGSSLGADLSVRVGVCSRLLMSVDRLATAIQRVCFYPAGGCARGVIISLGSSEDRHKWTAEGKVPRDLTSGMKNIL